ncbi:Hypothetical protein LUCI_1336 [Lucifera butyrica]|uniref:L,D-TPase catalytic domain-containing protein n=1 Tax=Lucifera butyrica TaxID=1351585 RepID=A0A498R3X6_9FIRM|nr:L,D-transpeptidase [Lucifera butyrica]VBB06121.1 Hypothetical protein LUCI_1336 [Lucifera butyrica]
MKWASLGWILLGIILAVAIWRGFPPFQIRSNQFPGILSSSITPDPQHVKIEIFKAERKLILYQNEKPVGIFKIALGFSPIGDKEREGDGKTPEGDYAICYVNDKTPYLYFYGLNYPQGKDIKRGFKQGRISQRQYQELIDNNKNNGIPLWNTALGGEVGIHGGGNLWDWTKGCIALSDTDILILKKYLMIGTPVHIFP